MYYLFIDGSDYLYVAVKIFQKIRIVTISIDKWTQVGAV